VSPVEDATLCVPLVLATETHLIPGSQRDPWREVNVVRDQERMPRPRPDDETLMAGAVVVIREDPIDDSGDDDHLARTTALEELENLFFFPILGSDRDAAIGRV